MAVESDLKRWDVFSDPLWLLDRLFNRYKVVRLPTNAGWGSDNAGSGWVYQDPWYLHVGTGTTANSRGLAWRTVYGLNSGDRSRYALDWSKRLWWLFTFHRENSDPEVVGRIQLKTANTEGALTDIGIGLEINNYDVVGEAYGTARGTVNLGTLTNSRIWRVKIVHVPGVRVEFWVNGVLAGTLTGDHVPTGSVAYNYYVQSIINGATGGVDAVLQVGNLIIVQEW